MHRLLGLLPALGDHLGSWTLRQYMFNYLHYHFFLVAWLDKSLHPLVAGWYYILETNNFAWMNLGGCRSLYLKNQQTFILIRFPSMNFWFSCNHLWSYIQVIVTIGLPVVHYTMWHLHRFIYWLWNSGLKNTIKWPGISLWRRKKI